MSTPPTLPNPPASLRCDAVPQVLRVQQVVAQGDALYEEDVTTELVEEKMAYAYAKKKTPAGMKRVLGTHKD